MMILNIEHEMLVSAPDFATAERHVRLFFEKSQLVHYDSIGITRQECLNGNEEEFQRLVKEGIDQNRRILGELLAKLNREGCSTLQDILTLPQGFQSKLLHTISHLLDGFFGIDSKLYDIDEMSHWITANRQEELKQRPETCWLLRVKAQMVYGQGFENQEND